MSSALNRFERDLVKASRRLHAEAELASPAEAKAGAPRASRRWHLVRRARRLGTAVQLGLAVTSVSALAGGGAVAYLALAGIHTQTLAEVQCNTARASSAGINTITGNPLIDCAAAWPSATAGRAAAPPLAAWELDSGTEVAVVQPASWGRPSPLQGVAWRRLPADWTVNLKVVELTDQLSDISISPYGGLPCTYANQDERVVRSLLDADKLSGWHIVLTPFRPGATVSAGCHFTMLSVDGETQTVQLSQAGPIRKVRLAPQVQKQINAGNVADHKLLVVETSVNRTLAVRCETVHAAAALWTTRARAGGFNQATLVYWRAVNTMKTPVPVRLSAYYYTLVKQPASQHTGSCAHVLVMRAGGGSLTVYAARITP